ncbi:MAG: hypothetical protein SXG53_12210 [Pseudomonadota bacterium]|nr:hypothetical protein [Pseudomonadota bacterium]
MWIVLALVAAGGTSCAAALTYLMVRGHWWHAGLLCLAIGGAWCLARACKEPWHGGPQ